jgi:hypothetical protein
MPAASSVRTTASLLTIRFRLWVTSSDDAIIPKAESSDSTVERSDRLKHTSKVLKQSTALVVVNYHRAVLRVVESAWAPPHLPRGQVHKLTARADMIRCRCVLVLVSLCMGRWPPGIAFDAADHQKLCCKMNANDGQAKPTVGIIREANGVHASVDGPHLVNNNKETHSQHLMPCARCGPADCQTS